MWYNYKQVVRKTIPKGLNQISVGIGYIDQ